MAGGASQAALRQPDEVDVSTRLDTIFTGVTREHLAASPGLADPRAYLGPARDAVGHGVARLLRTLAGA
ncbi:hypothetical protein AB0P12_26650 [Streptomyces subrutilus]|uniref:hypothetical protein n=1 Tax=Streptomyces subrutilus TaxID=36818 RepID=UPI003401B1F6